jgi:hypothetical protein
MTEMPAKSEYVQVRFPLKMIRLSRPFYRLNDHAMSSRTDPNMHDASASMFLVGFASDAFEVGQSLELRHVVAGHDC